MRFRGGDLNCGTTPARPPSTPEKPDPDIVTGIPARRLAGTETRYAVFGYALELLGKPPRDAWV